MSHYTATFKICFEKAATTFDAALAITDHIYQIDETYVQHFYVWVSPRLQDAAMSGLCWTLIALFDIAHWLIDTTQRFMAIDAQAIAYLAFAQEHDPLPNLPALCPAFGPLALPTTVSQGLTVLPIATEEFWATTVDVTPEITLISAAPGPFHLALCPAMVPLSMHSAFTPVDPGYALLNTILDSGFFSIDAETIAQNTPLIVQGSQPIVPVAETPAKTPKKPRKPKKNQSVADAPVTAQTSPRKRS